MRIIIVGGGVAGLTLANALEHAGIDFVLLEARGLIDPQVGASIAVGAGAMRVLDQVGAAKEVEDQTVPVKWTKHHNADGSLIVPPDTATQLLDARFAYPICFLDRQLVLRALSHTIKQQDKILLNKRLASVNHSEAGVTVHCEDGTSYDGDLIVGCDGVHSKVRDCMWQLAGTTDPSYFPESERTKMSAEYSCLFGISNAVQGMNPGDLDYTYSKGLSFVILTGKNGRVFWFLFQKLDKKYYWHEADFPRYTQADAERVAGENAWRKCHENISFGDVWEQRVSYTLVPMEEALFDKWHWGRFATIGDNAHKMTANHAQAGQNAIESAVALANQLKRVHDSKDVSFASIRQALTAWQAKRQARTAANWKAAAFVCRMQGLAGRAEWVFVYVGIPYAASLLTDLVTDAIVGSEILEFLPVPARSVTGTCHFNPKAGVGFQESLVRRALTALPLLAISAAVAYTLSGKAAVSESLLVDRTSTPQWAQASSFVADYGVLYAIWLIEASRRANAVTPTRFASVFGLLSHFFGIGLIAPIYFFSHYLFATLDKFGPADMRLTKVGYVRTVLPVLLALVYIPWLCFSTTSTWYLLALPPLVFAAQRILVKWDISPDTDKQDALTNTTRDLPHLRVCAYVLSALAGAAHLYTSYPTFLSLPLAWDSHSALSISSLLWMALLVRDLLAGGRISQREAWGFTKWGVLLAVVIGGPGAVGVLWVWREELLATRKHRDAVTGEKIGLVK